MIPNLHDLPPPVEEEHPLKKLVRPTLGMLCMLALIGGMIWLYTVGIKKAANEEMNLNGALQGIAADLWLSGTAAEVREMDPDLSTEIARLRIAVGSIPQVVVMPSEDAAGSSHELLYLKGRQRVLAVLVFVDEAGGKVDVRSFRTAPEFRAPAQ